MQRILILYSLINVLSLHVDFAIIASLLHQYVDSLELHEAAPVLLRSTLPSLFAHTLPPLFFSGSTWIGNVQP